MNNRKVYTCMICNESVQMLKIHLNKIHSISLQDYWIKYILEQEEGPICKLESCANPVSFEENHKRFREFCSSSCKQTYFMTFPKYKESVGNTFRKLWQDESFKNAVSNRTSARFKDPEYKFKIAGALRLADKDPKVIESRRQRLIIRNKTPEARASSSKTAKRTQADYSKRKNIGLGLWNKKGYFYSAKLGQLLFYRSSWEEKAMQLFDYDLMIWYYECEPIIIPYIYNGEEHNYYPDFLVEDVFGNKEIIEIKPIAFLTNEINKVKFAAAEHYCKANNMKFSIWTQNELGI